MDSKNLFKKFYNRVARQGLLKALLTAVIAGLTADFLVAFVLWFTDLTLLPVLLATVLTFAVVTGVSLPIFYFKFFHPTIAKIASLIDRLGLEERMVTMYEMEKDESYIAMLQREDAKAKLKNVNKRNVNVKVSRTALILLAVTFVLGTSMTTVSVLAASGNLRGGNEIFTPSDKDKDDDGENKKEYVTVTYLAEEGGVIKGVTIQKIEKGSDAEPVTALAMDGYQFVVWDDGILTAQRWDWSVTEDMTVTAEFEKLPEESGDGEEGEDGEGNEDKDGNDKESGDKDGDGSDGNKNDENGNNDGESNGDHSDDDGMDGAPGEGDGPQGEGGPDYGNGGNMDGSGGGNSGDNDGSGPDHGDGNGNGIGPGSAPGHNTDNNFVVDGKTNYHDIVDVEKNKEELAENGSIPPELKDLLEGYFDSLNP